MSRPVLAPLKKQKIVSAKTPKGSLVRFRGEGGSDFDLEQANAFLDPRKLYTLASVEQGRAFLLEVEDECFNAAMFVEMPKK